MKYRLRETELPWREINGEVIVLDIASGTYLGGNAAGSLLWKKLAQGATEEELVDCLVAAFELEHVDASSDVKTFVDELQAAGLLAG